MNNDFYVPFRGWPIPGANFDGGDPKHYVCYTYNPLFTPPTPPPFIKGNLFNQAVGALPTIIYRAWYTDPPGPGGVLERGREADYYQPNIGGSVRGGQPLFGKQYWEVEIVELPNRVPPNANFNEGIWTGGAPGEKWEWPIGWLRHIKVSSTKVLIIGGFKWPSDLDTFYNPIIGLWPDDRKFSKRSVIGLDDPKADIRSIGAVRTSVKLITYTPGTAVGYIGDLFEAPDVKMADTIVDYGGGSYGLIGLGERAHIGDAGVLIPFNGPPPSAAARRQTLVFKGRGDALAAIKTAGVDNGPSSTRSGVWTGVDLDELKQGGVVMMATDTQSRKVWFGVNGSWKGPNGGSANPAADVGHACLMDGVAGARNYFPGASIRLGPTRLRFIFERKDFNFTPPDGFDAYSYCSDPN
jgi:hypothetical protein